MSALPGQGLSTQVELYISCQNLKNMDVLSKSDPCVKVEMRFGTPPNTTWRVLGCTEMIKDQLSPEFTKTFTVEYKFEEQQPLRFHVYDIDAPVFRGSIGRSDDLQGILECQLGEICGSRGQVLRRPLVIPGKTTRRSYGTITVRAEEVSTVCNDTVVLKASGVNLKNMDIIGKTDGYYILKRQNRDQTWTTLFKSEIIPNNLNPHWQPRQFTMSKLCRGDRNMRIRVEVWDKDKITKDDFVGYAYFTAQELIDSRGTKDYTLKIAESGRKARSRRGDIRFETQIIKNYTFFEYLTGGLEISLVVAIDFTGSNGNPRQPGTLHYHQPGVMNEYESAIRSVGEILSNYDSDNSYPVFGFGARMPNGQVSHCFALNGTPQQPEVQGVEGILQSYHQALTNVQLYGPTYFTQVINIAAQAARAEPVCQDMQKYFILLIITDGIINDFDQTISAIVEASQLPLSIIIVGVGQADFSAMDELDCDEGLLRSASGKVALRDIVQFVPYTQFKNTSYELLAKETLAEVPGQVTQFFKHRRIVPNRRPEVSFAAPMSGAQAQGAMGGWSDARAGTSWGAVRGQVGQAGGAPPQGGIVPQGPPPGYTGGAPPPQGGGIVPQGPPAYPPPQGGAPPAQDESGGYSI